MVLLGNQLLADILAQVDSMTESRTGNTTESSEGEDFIRMDQHLKKEAK